MIKVFSPANIAFIKHWGMTTQGLPTSNSLSMNLSGCFTETEVDKSLSGFDEIELMDNSGKTKKIVSGVDSRDDKIFELIDVVRSESGSTEKIRIFSKNSFPTRAGIASSASGFSALSIALLEYFKVDYDKQKLVDTIAKAGSISAVRSVVDCFGKVEVVDQKLKVSQCNEFNELDLVDLVVVVSTASKKNSSFEGQIVADSSPFYKAKYETSNRNIELISEFAKAQNLNDVGRLIELEAVMLHSVMLTSEPAQYYINPATFVVVNKILELRQAGLNCYYTIDAGANVHVITNQSDSKKVESELKKLDVVIDVIYNIPCKGTHVIK